MRPPPRTRTPTPRRLLGLGSNHRRVIRCIAAALFAAARLLSDPGWLERRRSLHLPSLLPPPPPPPAERIYVTDYKISGDGGRARMSSGETVKSLSDHLPALRNDLLNIHPGTGGSLLRFPSLDSSLMENTQNKLTPHTGSFHFAVAAAVPGTAGGTTTTATCLMWLQATRETVQLPRNTVTRNLFFLF